MKTKHMGARRKGFAVSAGVLLAGVSLTSAGAPAFACEETPEPTPSATKSTAPTEKPTPTKIPDTPVPAVPVVLKPVVKPAVKPVVKPVKKYYPPKIRPATPPPAPTVLPYTGAETALGLGLAGSLVGVGGLLRFSARRRKE